MAGPRLTGAFFVREPLPDYFTSMMRSRLDFDRRVVRPLLEIGTIMPLDRGKHPPTTSLANLSHPNTKHPG